MADLDAWVQAQLKRGYSRQQINAYLARMGYAVPYPSSASATAQPSMANSKAFKLPYALIVLAAIAVAGVALLWLADSFNPSSQRNASKQQLLCDEFKDASYNVTCNEAAALALADTPGEVENVSVGTIQIPEPSVNELTEIPKPFTLIKKDAWLIDIKLQNPYFKEKSGKEVKSLRIGVGLNEDIGIHRRPLVQ